MFFVFFFVHCLLLFCNFMWYHVSLDEILLAWQDAGVPDTAEEVQHAVNALSGTGISGLQIVAM